MVVHLIAFVSRFSGMANLAAQGRSRFICPCVLAMTLPLTLLQACAGDESPVPYMQACALQWQSLAPSETLFEENSKLALQREHEFYVQCMKRSGFEQDLEREGCRSLVGKNVEERAECYQRHEP
jgi:hypothetical protein